MPRYVCHEHRFLLWTIRKCATQSVKAWIRESPLIVTGIGRRRARRLDGYVRAAIVRNPFERLISSWGRAKCTYKPGQAGRSGRFERDIWGIEREHLENFVLEASRVNDPHWRPQTNTLCNKRGELHVERLLRVESLAADWRSFCEHVGMSHRPLPRRNAHDQHPSPLKQRRYTDYREYFTPCAREIAETLYERDLELLGYQFDS